ncbi:MFS transporter [Bacillus coagulans]|uniref:MFS transporter n=1 Tax=Heyndrickxia coagulans TaxID=1398 RepID=UPI001377E545|nr:MFS transporter [Heyndrickxia coagulans]NCG68936.1 MFS transporter [Heyndrickxia coagulans]
MFRKVNEGWMSFLVRFFNSLGFYIFTPLLALWLTETKSLDLSKASIIVASLTLFSKAGGAFVGGLIDRLGVRLSLILGLWSSGGILMLIPVVPFFPLFIALSALLGTAITLYNVALKTQISFMNEHKRLRAFALLNIAVNLGASIGPLAGGWILDLKSFWLMFFAAGSYFIAGGVACLLPQPPLEKEENRLNPFKYLYSERYYLLKSPFFRFLFGSGLLWFFYIQMFSTMPVYISGEITGKTTGLVFTLNAVTVIAFQGIFPSVQPKLKKEQWYALSFLLFGSSFFLLWIDQTVVSVFLSMFLFSLSEVIWTPLIDTEILQKRGNLSSSWAFGIAGVVWGLWESFGSYAGLSLLKSFPEKLYLLLAVLSVLIGLSLIFLSLSMRKGKKMFRSER